MRLSPITLLIAGTTLVRLAFAATTGLGVDESYMVTAGRVLSLGYFDHPPASWWLSWGAANLLGTEGPWAVRLPFILLFALSQALLWRITDLIAGQPAAFWAVVALNLSPVFGVTTGTWVLPDGPLDAALLAATLCLLNALPKTLHGAEDRQALGWWAAAGLCAGFALFSKYSAVLTIGGVFLYLLANRAHRHWLMRIEPYVATGIALAVFSPVLIWNAMHGWVSFAFQSDRAAGLRFQPLMPIQTLFGEALFVLPWIWVPMMILFVRGFRRDTTWSQRLLVFMGAPPIVVFALISTWSSQRILYHWAAPGYLMLFPMLGEAIASRLDRPLVRRTIAGSAILTLTVVTVIATQLQFGWLGASLASFVRKDPTPEGLDWTSIRKDLAARGLLPPGALVASLSWRDAGKIAYALGPDTTMLCLNTDARQFGLAHPLEEFAGRDVLLLVVDPPPPAAQWFQTMQALPNSSVRLQGRVLRTVTVFRGEKLIPPPKT